MKATSNTARTIHIFFFPFFLLFRGIAFASGVRAFEHSSRQHKSIKPHSDKTVDSAAQKSLNVGNTVSPRNRLNASVKRSFVGRKFESVKLVKRLGGVIPRKRRRKGSTKDRILSYSGINGNYGYLSHLLDACNSLTRVHTYVRPRMRNGRMSFRLNLRDYKIDERKQKGTEGY